jgi:glycosyltransferase involved in cell wall biosynthesis
MQHLDASRSVTARHPATEHVTVILPAYNEARRLPGALPALLDIVPPRTEIIVVDDGSTDDTSVVARRLLGSVPQARVVSFPTNRGKGAAVRAGMSFATGRIAVFCDADGATDVGHLPELIRALDRADIAVGTRVSGSEAVQETDAARALLRSGFRRWTSTVLDLDTVDTQCGFKAFRMPIAKLLFSLVRSDGFAFDVEVLALAHRLGMRIDEVPVRWTAVPGSKVRPVKDSVAMAAEVVRIRRRLRSHDGTWSAGERDAAPSRRTVVDLRDRVRVRPAVRREVASAAGWWG